MWAFMSGPYEEGRYPGVVVLHHALGLDDEILSYVRRISQAGYYALAPTIYHRQDPNLTDWHTRIEKLRDYDVILDLRSTVARLRSHPSVKADRIGIVGFCVGGRAAYMAAGCELPLKAAAVFYGSNISTRTGAGPTPLDLTYLINCPVIGFFGEEDPNPSREDVEKIHAEMTRHDKVHEFHSYPGAGHSFMSEGTRFHSPQAAKDAWEKLMAWFHRYLQDYQTAEEKGVQRGEAPLPGVLYLNS